LAPAVHSFHPSLGPGSVTGGGAEETLFCPLSRAPAVATSAFQWLLRLYNEQSCNLVHPWDAPYNNNSYAFGQNLASFSGDPTIIKFGNSNATQLWVNEKQAFTYNKFPTACTNSNAALCGHYTQVIRRLPNAPSEPCAHLI